MFERIKWIYRELRMKKPVLSFLLVLFLVSCVSQEEDWRVIINKEGPLTKEEWKKVFELRKKEDELVKQKLFGELFSKENISKMNNPFYLSPEDITEQELRKQAQIIAGDTIGKVEYMGRKDNFDFYILRRNIGAGRYKIKVPNNVTKKPFPYSENKDDWLNVGPFKEDGWLPWNN